MFFKLVQRLLDGKTYYDPKEQTTYTPGTTVLGPELTCYEVLEQYLAQLAPTVMNLQNFNQLESTWGIQLQTIDKAIVRKELLAQLPTGEPALLKVTAKQLSVVGELGPMARILRLS